jgi:hypothetical protein
MHTINHPIIHAINGVFTFSYRAVPYLRDRKKEREIERQRKRATTIHIHTNIEKRVCCSHSTTVFSPRASSPPLNYLGEKLRILNGRERGRKKERERKGGERKR